MDEFTQLIQEICSLRFEDETSSEIVGGNRIKLFNVVAKLFPKAIIQVWLADLNHEEPGLLLAYVHPKERFGRDANLFSTRCITSTTETAEDFLIINRPKMTVAVENVFAAIGTEMQSTYHCTIERVLSVKRKAIQPDNMPNILGWAAIGFPYDHRITSEERSIISLIRTQLAMLLEQSRYSRILELTKQCEALLREFSSKEDVVRSLIKLLAETCGAGSYKLYSIVGRQITRIWQNKKDDVSYFDNWISSTFEVSSQCKRYFLPLEATKPSKSTPPNSVLAIPIALKGRKLEPHDFLPLSAEPNGARWVSVVVNYVFLACKRSPFYLGGSFSETDLMMADTVSHLLEDFMRSQAFEKQYVYISEFFESLQADAQLSYERCNEHLISALPVVSDIQIVEIDKIEDVSTWLTNNNESKSPISAMIADKIKTFASSLDDEQTIDQREAISLCSASAEGNGMYLIFHLPTKYFLQRYAILTLESNLVDQVSLDILVHFIKELHMYFRTEDATKERGSMLAQIRHAVVAPLAAAKFNLEIFQDEFDRSVRLGIGWRELLEDEEFRELIPSAIGLANQSLIIAQTGRYLLGPVANRHLKIKHYNVVDLVNSTKKSFVWQIAERKLAFRLTVNGRYTGVMTGDETMLWIVMSNLIDNAIKFAHVRTEVAVLIDLHKDHYRFEIYNRGVHLPRHERAKVFRPYTRGSQEGNLNRRPGTGLGVPVADMLLRAHSESARLDFKSERNEQKGYSETRFFFEMPYLIGMTSKV